MQEEHPDRTFVFVGGSLCLDFINTQLVEGGRPLDLLTDFSDLVAWLVQADVLDAKEATEALSRWGTRPEGARTFEHALALRTAVRKMVEQIVQRRAVPHTTVEVINRFLRQRHGYPQLVRRREGFEQRFRWDVREAVQLLTPIADSTSDLLCHGDLSLIKTCDNPACVLYFYDTTKNHARRWCSMSLCGNRMKVAAHYRRYRRSSGEGCSGTGSSGGTS